MMQTNNPTQLMNFSALGTNGNTSMDEKIGMDISFLNANSMMSSTHIENNEAMSYSSSTVVTQSCGNNRQKSLFQKTLPFPWKLHQLLEDVEYDGQEHIVSWLPGGECFRVHKPKEFCSIIMPNYFRQTKFNSFTRQLYIYGFSKIEGGRDDGGFFHPNFVKGNRSEAMLLGRNECGDRRLKKYHQVKRANGGSSGLMKKTIASSSLTAEILSAAQASVQHTRGGFQISPNVAQYCENTDNSRNQLIQNIGSEYSNLMRPQFEPTGKNIMMLSTSISALPDSRASMSSSSSNKYQFLTRENSDLCFSRNSFDGQESSTSSRQEISGGLNDFEPRSIEAMRLYKLPLLNFFDMD